MGLKSNCGTGVSTPHGPSCPVALDPFWIGGVSAPASTPSAPVAGSTDGLTWLSPGDGDAGVGEVVGAGVKGDGEPGAEEVVGPGAKGDGDPGAEEIVDPGAKGDGVGEGVVVLEAELSGAWAGAVVLGTEPLGVVAGVGRDEGVEDGDRAGGSGAFFAAAARSGAFRSK